MYQPDGYHPAYTNHYPNQYPTSGVTLPTPLSYFAFQTQQLPVKPEPIPPEPPEPAVTPKVASKAIERLILLELQHAGFESAEKSVVKRLELEVSTFVQQLFQRAHEYANLANRARSIASDVLMACEDLQLPPKKMNEIRKRTARRRKGRKGQSKLGPIELIKSISRPTSPELLSSDDEETSAVAPTTLSNLPHNFPGLPPKHTYHQTPASPPKKAALPSLEKKLETAALVQESLQNLLTATEDAMNQEDGELLGHIVNWELSVQPRKRWCVSKATTSNVRL